MLSKSKAAIASYFDEGELADNVKRVVCNDDFAVMIDPTLTTEEVMNTRRRFVPRIQLSRPYTVSYTATITERRTDSGTK